jgi:hypothetical protein
MDYEGDRMSGRNMGGPAIHLHVIEVGLIWGLSLIDTYPNCSALSRLTPHMPSHMWSADEEEIPWDTI